MTTQKTIETKTEEYVPSWKLQLKDFIPIIGLKNYNWRNGIRKETILLPGEEAENRSTRLYQYNAAIIGGLAYATYQCFQALTG